MNENTDFDNPFETTIDIAPKVKIKNRKMSLRQYTNHQYFKIGLKNKHKEHIKDQ